MVTVHVRVARATARGADQPAPAAAVQSARMSSELPRLEQFPAFVAKGGAIRVLPEFTGGEWYEALERDTADDGADGHLVSWHTFAAPWDSWEMHPIADELVLCIAGGAELVQQIDGDEVRIALTEGRWLINPAGVWHTADVAAGASATCVFVTAGLGTQIRPR